MPPGNDLMVEPAGFLSQRYDLRFNRTRFTLKDARGNVRGKSVVEGRRTVHSGWSLGPARVPVAPEISLQTLVKCFCC